MERNSTPQANEEVGYLVVKVSTARGAIPLENAAVSIRGSSPENSDVIYSLTTNSDGITEKVSLPAPARALSEKPGTASPFSRWNVDVFKDGYIPVTFQNVPVYASIVSVQPAVLVPAPENFRGSVIYNESGTPNL